MNRDQIVSELITARSDEDRIAVLDRIVATQQENVLKIRCDLALAEGELEGLLLLRESIGAPKLSPKHTLRARVTKYLDKNPGAGTSEIAVGLCAPVTTISMCLGRNKHLFERTPTDGWTNKKTL